MKNKIIAVFTACFMICGVFSYNAGYNADDIDVFAVETVEHEKKHGSIRCYNGIYTDIDIHIFMSELDSDYNYNGDSTTDIDWSKYKNAEVYGIPYDTVVSWNKEKNDLEIFIDPYNMSFSGYVIIYFEDMEYRLDIAFYDITRIVTTSCTTTTSTTTTAVTTTKPREEKKGNLYLRPISLSYLYISKLDSYSDYYGGHYSGDSISDIDWSKYTDISVNGSGVSAYWSDSDNDIVISLDNSGYHRTADITISFEDMDFIISVDYAMITTIPTTTATTTTQTIYITRPTTTTTTTTAVPSLRIIPSFVNMNKGDTNKLAIVGASNISDVMWTSEDTSVATVSENGTVTAKGAGSTVIYAVYNGNVASCTIKVDSNNAVYGDANNDGIVDLADATSIIQHIGNEGRYALSEQGFANADTNADGKITGADALIIQKIEAGQISIDQLPYKE